MRDINNNEITINSIVKDFNDKQYVIVEKNNELYAKSLFDDCGCGEYVLYQERIIRNGFTLV